MSIESQFGNLFKPEVKSSGQKLVSQEKISLSTASDTGIQAYARGSPPCKITLKSPDISSSSFSADCTCPAAQKNRFCKHVWATLLQVESEHPDFLSNKRDIENTSSEPSAAPSKQSTYQETAKARASEHRKAQYQKSKDYAKAKKRSQKGQASESSSNFPEEIEASMAYFTLNGFPMPNGPSPEILTEAKRTLSRVFHPDKGGSHDESVELNHHCQVILEFLK
jgi:uncharacterized Zn finger protein